MKIRTKIFLGFLILSVMLATAGAYSIYELTSISLSVRKLLDENYKSITASKQMIEALEREDNGLLLLLSGSWEKGRSTLRDADQNFKQAFAVAADNITIPGEKKLIDQISAAYEKYTGYWDRPTGGMTLEDNLSWYFKEIHRQFEETKSIVQELMSLNDAILYQTASDLQNRAHRTIMPGIVAFLSAILFSVVFNFFVNLYFVNPILRLNKAVKTFLQTGRPMQIEIDTKDELKDLTETIANLTRWVRIPSKNIKDR